MKNVTRLLFAAAILGLASCGVFGKTKEGCPSNGRNVGAEKILNGEGPKKQPKFKGAQPF